MTSAEARLGSDVPILVHSDLSVVDDRLRPIHPSFLRYQSGLATPTAFRSRTLLAQNLVTGCATRSTARSCAWRCRFPTWSCTTVARAVRRGRWGGRSPCRTRSCSPPARGQRRRRERVLRAGGAGAAKAGAWWERGGRNFVRGVRQRPCSGSGWKESDWYRDGRSVSTPARVPISWPGTRRPSPEQRHLYQRLRKVRAWASTRRAGSATAVLRPRAACTSGSWQRGARPPGGSA